jgi:eukaryotic-like serine/threonine-protein kinase
MTDTHFPTLHLPQQQSGYSLFISYSRRDQAFVRHLWEALTQADQKVWIDWHDIPPAKDWRQEIYQGIEAADNFVFIISLHSLNSDVCNEELEHAIQQGKRIIPIVREEVNRAVPPELARLNWLFFRESDDFGCAFKTLLETLQTDVSYIRSHTRLLVKAREWEQSGHDNSFLLRGRDLEQAEQWLSQDQESPKPTALQQAYIYSSRQVETERQFSEMQLRKLTPQQVKNRHSILNKVKKFWVEGVLEKSLQDQVLIELGLEEHTNAVMTSWNIEVETIDEAPKVLPQGIKPISVFDSLGEGRTLLILGEPGAGKTTTLLELTRDLVKRSEQGLDHRIPIVFNLSSWATKQSIAEWLVDELSSKYQVPKKIGREWVSNQELLLLLDGLDEVKLERRNECVVALNHFHQNYGSEMVVCSRIKDYEALKGRLNFQTALYLRSLTIEQIHDYLDSIDADLSGLRSLLNADHVLQELAASPLMLNIMVLAYQDINVEELPRVEAIEERRKQLFDAYIEKMFHRPTRLKRKDKYSEAQIKQGLAWLAQRMVQESQTVFLIERLQPNWLQSNFLSWLYDLSCGTIFGALTGFTVWPLVVLFEPVRFAVEDGSNLFNHAAGLSFGIAEGLLWGLAAKFTGKLISTPTGGLIFCLISGFFWGCLASLGFHDVLGGWIFISPLFSLFWALIGLFLWSLLKEPIQPASKLQWSWRRAFRGMPRGMTPGLVCGGFLGLIIAIVDGVTLDIEISTLFSEFTVSLATVSSTLGLQERLFFVLINGLINALVLSLIFEVLGGVISGFVDGIAGQRITETTKPNQGIQQAVVNSVIMFVFVSVFFAACLLLFFALLSLYPNQYVANLPPALRTPIFALNILFSIGALSGFLVFGKTFIKHLILRILLWFEKSVPLNYSRFLNYAVDCIFLKRVGGGYIFVHRLLLNHFAEIDL